jgi:hypothetical protein
MKSTRLQKCRSNARSRTAADQSRMSSSNEMMLADSSDSTTNGKKANGSNEAAEVDLGSAASSANTSGDEEEADEEEEGENDDIVVISQSKRTTRSSSASKTRSSLQKSSNSNLRTRRPQRGGSGSLHNKSSSKIKCTLCSDSVADLGDHLALVHFRAKLAKLLPSQPPFKCPKCAFCEDGLDSLISHYGAEHKLNERFVEEELKSASKKVNGGQQQQQPRRSSRMRTSSIELLDDNLMTECKLCGANVLKTSLKEHGFDDHFKEEILRPLPRSLPFSCPKCSVKCDDFDSLSAHFVKAHDPMEAFLSRLNCANGSSTSYNRKNALKDDEDDEHDHEEDEDLEVTFPSANKEISSNTPAAWLSTKPTDDDEYHRQIHKYLRLKDGRKAKAVDDRSVKCVCGKVIRVNFKYNWKFMIQRPTLRDGVMKPKGHWFNCSEVTKGGSLVPDWKFTKEEMEASKNTFRGCEAADQNNQSGTPSPSEIVLGTKRRSRKRVFLAEIDYDGKKAKGDSEDEASDEDEDYDYEEEEATPREQRLMIRKRVNDMLATRVPGEIFLQDGPCFQVKNNNSEKRK